MRIENDREGADEARQSMRENFWGVCNPEPNLITRKKRQCNGDTTRFEVWSSISGFEAACTLPLTQNASDASVTWRTVFGDVIITHRVGCILASARELVKTISTCAWACASEHPLPQPHDATRSTSYFTARLVPSCLMFSSSAGSWEAAERIPLVRLRPAATVSARRVQDTLCRICTRTGPRLHH
jgi:hypothetical protein